MKFNYEATIKVNLQFELTEKDMGGRTKEQVLEMGKITLDKVALNVLSDSIGDDVIDSDMDIESTLEPIEE